MIFRRENWKTSFLWSALSLALLGGLTSAATPGAPQITADQKSKVTGTIVASNSNLVKVTH